MYQFQLNTPTSLGEAIGLLAEPEAQALGGGQTLIPVLKQRLAAPGLLVGLGSIAELSFVRQNGDLLAIGGATRHADVARLATAFPALAQLANGIGDPAVRNRGTIGGSLANNDPAACYPSATLACSATILTDRREIAAEDFFQGLFTTALEPGEIIVEVRFPIPKKAAYQKFRQPASRFALTAVFVAQGCGGAGDAVGVGVTGAATNGVFRWSQAEVALTGRFSESALADVPVPPAAEMMEDLHATPAYRAALVKAMTLRAVTAALRA